MAKVYNRNISLIVLYVLILYHTKATKEFAQPVTQWDYMHYLQKLGEAEPNEDPAENVVAAEDTNEEKRSYEPLLHTMRGKRYSQGTLLRYMVGGRPSSSKTAGTRGLWKHQSIYKGKRPAHAQLPLLHQLLGYIGKREIPNDRGTFWKLPFGKRSQDFKEDEGDNEGASRQKRHYNQIPLLHYNFGKRVSYYEPLLHNMAGKRSWNDFPIVLSRSGKYDNDMPLLHQFGFGKRTYSPLLHSMPGKREEAENDIDRAKRQRELLEHTIDENEDYYLSKRSDNFDDLDESYYDQNVDIGIRSEDEKHIDDLKRFIRRSPNPIRKRRSVEEDEHKEEEKKGWGSEKIDLNDLKSGSWFGKREGKENKRASPLLHQLGGISGERSPSQPAGNMYRNKKAIPLLYQVGPWEKKFNDDIVWGKMYQSLKRSTPMLHQIGGSDKRFDDDIMWDTYMNGMKRNAGKRFGDDIAWDTLMNGMKRGSDKRFDNDLKWDTYMNGMKRNHVPLLHQSFGKRFDDDLMWDTYMNGMKRDDKRFSDDIVWDTFMNGMKKRFGDDIMWDTYMNEIKRNNAPLLHQMFGKRFDDDITWDTFLSQMKRSHIPLLHQAFGKRFDDSIIWDTYMNGMKRNQAPLLHQSFGKKSEDKKAAPVLNQLGSFGKKSTPILHQLGMTGKRSDTEKSDEDEKRARPLLHQMGSVGKKSDAGDDDKN